MRKPTSFGHRFGLQMPLRQKKKILDVNTQACAVAIARFDPTPIMQETPESEKHNAGTDTNIGNVNLFDFQNESRFEVAAHWYKFNGDDE